MVAALGQALVMRGVVRPQFVQLEEQGARRDMARVQQAIILELKNVDVVCSAWAIWDDAVGFVTGRKPNFVEVNIPDDFFTLSSINYLHFFDAQGRSMYRKAIDPLTGNDFLFEDVFEKSNDLLFRDDVKTGSATLVKKGLVFIDGIPDPLCIVSRPIIFTNNSGHVQGTLIMGRFLDRKTIQQNIGVNFTFQSIEVIESVIETCEVLDLLTYGAPPPVLRIDDGVIYFYSIYNDIYGQPLGVLVGEKPTEIIESGASAIHTAMFCYFIGSVLFLWVVFFLISRSVTIPLRRLSTKTTRIVKSGNFATEIAVEQQGEISELGESVNALLRRIVDHEQLLLDANNKLLEQSLTDPLTGLANRRDFDAYMDNEWARMERNRLPLSVVMCDVDYFKKYNDAYGHQKGDHCLQALARVLEEVAQRPADLPARYGGEEFVLVLPETDAAGALHVARSVCDQVQALGIEHIVSDVSPHVTMSVGVATVIPTAEHTVDFLVQIADEALYKAKQQGRNRAVVF